MVSLRKTVGMGGGSSDKLGSVEGGTVDQFPAGLRVLVVDDDRACLKVLQQMLRKCLYHVTICSQAMDALSLLRERKARFDVVISDVHMPDMDGFKLLELVGLEMDLPVIMMSGDGRTSAVMKGIKHGACDYLIKPVRMEELKNIWQHVVRKNWNDSKDQEYSGSLEETDRQKRGNDDVEHASSANEVTESNWRSQKKKELCRDEEEDGELDNDEPSASKKPRVVWSVELHQQFVSAVNQLGIDQAVPKRILELMNVPGLTRENVASHLQKFRLYLKRMHHGDPHNSYCGPPNSYCGPPSSYCSPIENNHTSKLNSNPPGRLDYQSLAAASGQIQIQIPSQNLATALQAELLGRPPSCNNSSMVRSALEHPNLLQNSMPGGGPKFIPIEHGHHSGDPFNQPSLVKCSSNMSKPLFTQGNINLDSIVSSGYSDCWSSNNFGTDCPASSLSALNNVVPNSNNVIIAQQQQVQNPCVIIPSQSAATYPVPINIPASMNQNSFGRGNCGSTIIDYNTLLSSRTSNNASALCVGQMSDGNFKSSGLLNIGYGSMSGPNIDNNSSSSNSWKICNSGMNINSNHFGSIMGSDMSRGDPEKMLQHGRRNLGFVGGKGGGTCIPTRFAIDDDIDPLAPIDNMNDHQRNMMMMMMGDNSNSIPNNIKQEMDQLELLKSEDPSRGGNPVGNAPPHFPSNDYLSVISN